MLKLRGVREEVVGEPDDGQAQLEAEPFQRTHVDHVLQDSQRHRRVVAGEVHPC